MSDLNRMQPFSLDEALKEVKKLLPEGFECTIIAYPGGEGDMLVNIASDLDNVNLEGMLYVVMKALHDGLIQNQNKMNLN